MHRLVIDRAGRVVIPKSVRAELRLEPGDALEMEKSGEQIILRPVRGAGPVAKERGIWVLSTGKPMPASMTDELLQQIREERDIANLGLVADRAAGESPANEKTDPGLLPGDHVKRRRTVRRAFPTTLQ